MAGKPSQLRTILLADHEAETRSLVAAVLQRAGYDVVQIYTGLIYRGPELVNQVARALKRERVAQNA